LVKVHEIRDSRCGSVCRRATSRPGEYINPALGGREVQTASLSFDRWIFELYRTAIETLQGIAWMLLVFFAFALIAYVIVRIGEARKEQTSSEA